MNLGVGQPGTVAPFTWDIPFYFPDLLDTHRWLCATVDPNDDITETSPNDNSVLSDRQFTIHQDFTCAP